MRKYVVLTCFVLALMTGGMVFADEESGGFPYEFFHNLHQLAATNKQSEILITSDLEGVAPEEIELTIHSAAQGDIRVGVDASGALIDFPITEQLLAENPVVTHNKPTGSLKIQMLAKFEKGEMPGDPVLMSIYDYLADGLRLAENRIRFGALAMMSSGLDMECCPGERFGHAYEKFDQSALELRYGGPGDDHVHVRTAERDEALHPVDGLVTIPAPDNLLQDDPWIQFCPAFTPFWEVKNKDGEWISIADVVDRFEKKPGSDLD